MASSVLVRSLLVALAGAGLGVASFAAAQACTPSDVAAVDRARATIVAHAPAIWPGWTQPPPVVVRGERNDCLLHHPDPPDGFVPDANGGHRMEGHVLPVPAATVVDVDGVWSVVVPTREELQSFVDDALGPGVVLLDEALYTRTIVHEAFHAHQLTLLGGLGEVPSFGVAQGDLPSLAEVASDPRFDDAHAEQGAALHAALTVPSSDDARAAAARFLNLRQRWREAAPAGTGPLEQQLEWIEGTARYADVRLTLASEPDATGRDAPDTTDARSELLEQLREPVAIPGGPRDRYAAFGAAQGLLLDRFDRDWQEAVLPGGAALESLLRSALDGS